MVVRKCVRKVLPEL